MTPLQKLFRTLLIPAVAALALAACGNQSAITSSEPAPVAVGSSGVTADVVTTNTWQGGYQGAVRITDTAFASPITSFAVVFKLGGSPPSANAWNGTITGPDASGNLTAKNPDWLQYGPIQKGQAWDVGFQASGSFSGATIVSLTVNGQNIPLSGNGGDTVPPTVSLGVSSNNVTAAGSVTLTATASDNVGVTKVEFYEGTTLLASDATAPYTLAVAYTSASNGTHSYSAAAYDAAGNVGRSMSVTVTVNIPTATCTAVPAAPTALAGTVVSATQANLSWTAVTPPANCAVTYSVFRNGTQIASNLTAASYQDTTVSAGNSYTYTVRAVDAAGQSAASNSAAVSIPSGGDTVPPTVSLTVSNNSVTAAGSVTLTATASDNVGVTRVEFYEGSTLLATDTTTPYTLVIAYTSASNGTHSYSAAAYDAAGNIGRSMSVAVTVNIPAATCTAIPAAPTNLTGSAPSSTSVNLSWTAVTPPANCSVTYSVLRGTSQVKTGLTTASYSDTALTANTTYSYTVRAVDSAGSSAASNAVAVTTPQGGTGGVAYTSSGGKFLKNGAEIKLFGLNWFGMETSDRVLHGLWTGRQLDDFLTDFQSKGFNALRLPLSPQTINPGYAFSSGPYSGADCTAICGKDGRAALEYTLSRMQALGMYALLDFHTCNPANTGSGLPGSPTGCSGYTLSNWLADLQTMATLSKTYSNVIGIDLTNEPWNLTWSAWSSLASQGGQAVLAVNPSTTVWVEGVGNVSTSGVAGGANWGQNLYEAGAISGIPANKLVYTPHSYGPSVAAMSYFTDSTFPNNMPAIWDTLFGHLMSQGYTVVLGEYGGQYTGTDKTWQDAFVTYLINKNDKSSFYWCVNPNSGDTGGVLQGDWKTWDAGKLALLQRLMN